MPKKVTWNAASIAETIRHDAKPYGFTVEESAPFDWSTFKKKRDAYVKRLNGIYEKNLLNDKVEYFHGLGFERPPQLTTGDYLTALTHPLEAKNLVRSGFVGLVPTTADEFASKWEQSFERQKLLQQLSHMQDMFDSEAIGIQTYRQVRTSERHPGL